MSNAMLRLWTIQPVVLWQEMQRNHWLRGHTDYVPEEFRGAYDWMRGQMAQRTLEYGGEYPVWAWHKPRPRRRDYIEYTVEGPLVCIEFMAESTKVLLSDFVAWGDVLNNCYVALDDKDDEKFADTYGRIKPLEGVSAHARQSIVTASWPRIFNLKAMRTGVFKKNRVTQAVVESVHLSQVRNVESFH